MSSKMKSRWADDEEDAVAEAQRKREKEERKRVKAAKQQRLEEANKARQQQVTELRPAPSRPQDGERIDGPDGESERPAKRRRLSPDTDGHQQPQQPAKVLRFPVSGWGPCRHVDNFEKLNHIEEGSYGWVSRAKETATGEVVALKKLKMDNANDGFPVTGLREIQTLMESRHSNIVKLREVVVGDSMNE